MAAPPKRRYSSVSRRTAPDKKPHSTAKKRSDTNKSRCAFPPLETVNFPVSPISLHYNIPTPTDVTTLSVKVKPEASCISTSHKPRLTLNVTSLYSGKETTTNMVILDIKMLSGFVPDPESLKRLQDALLVDRVEQKQDHVMVYIRELPKDIAINHSLELIQELPVQNLKPAVVKIYDYYQPSDQAETEYISPCAAGNNLE
ncbi:pregnancy zone protein-like [Seriola aureovittata]|uniref:pregnancy zone protein-like n=1 Tax=Seriola aureovittata TaxID=2871759 RepID=UPI0024BEAE7E|nr:pregnancy zone protein-like [Seriola aureovittata]